MAQSIDDLVIFIRTRLDEDKGHFQDTVGNLYVETMMEVVDHAAWLIKRLGEPAYALTTLYYIGNMWNEHVDYRQEWKPLD